MRIAIGASHHGCRVRARLIAHLQRLGHEVQDFGVRDNKPVDYPDIAEKVAMKVVRGEADRGILIGGTAIGMSIAANKVAGIRAVPCHDDLTAEFSRRHNDANVLCLSAILLGGPLIERIVEIWLNTPFDGGRHARRLEKIAALEREAIP
jgi:ribose 5-phosphate isomerase B